MLPPLSMPRMKLRPPGVRTDAPKPTIGMMM